MPKSSTRPSPNGMSARAALPFRYLSPSNHPDARIPSSEHRTTARPSRFDVKSRTMLQTKMRFAPGVPQQADGGHRAARSESIPGHRSPARAELSWRFSQAVEKSVTAYAVDSFRNIKVPHPHQSKTPSMQRHPYRLYLRCTLQAAISPAVNPPLEYPCLLVGKYDDIESILQCSGLQVAIGDTR